MFADRLEAANTAVQARLDTVFSGLSRAPLTQAMRYALTGGKGLRGFLVLEGAALHGVGATHAIWPACAIEAMHAYSLVHDDLPCMDDDDLRRGQPTLHIRWDEATAVLAGDALQALAFELAGHTEAGPPHIRADLTLSLARAAGAAGMVMGQASDIAAETAQRALTLDEITALQRDKTGALIEWAACAGPRLAGGDMTALHRYSRALGLAFQIADDILDVEGDAEAAGKRLQKDAAAGKATFVSLLGLDGAKRRAEELVQSASDALDIYGPEAETLRQAARFVISRDS